MIKKERQKYHLTKSEEFEVLKMVLDKYLWLGTIALMYGCYMIIDKSKDLTLGIIVTLIGAAILLLFTAIVSRDLNFKKIN